MYLSISIYLLNSLSLIYLSNVCMYLFICLLPLYIMLSIYLSLEPSLFNMSISLSFNLSILINIIEIHDFWISGTSIILEIHISGIMEFCISRSLEFLYFWKYRIMEIWKFLKYEIMYVCIHQSISISTFVYVYISVSIYFSLSLSSPSTHWQTGRYMFETAYGFVCIYVNKWDWVYLFVCMCVSP